MSTETRSELIIVTVIAVFLAVLWWMNMRNGAGSGLQSILPMAGSGGPDAFDVAAPNLGGVSYAPGGSTFNIGGATNYAPGNAVPGSCGCAASDLNGAWGTAADMSQFLVQNPSYIQSLTDGLTNWK